MHVVAGGALPHVRDAFRARAIEIAADGGPQIDMPFVGTGLGTERQAELLREIRAHLEALRVDVGPEVDVALIRLAPRDPAELVEGLHRKMRVDAAPTGVNHGECPARSHHDEGHAIREGEQRGRLGSVDDHGIRAVARLLAHVLRLFQGYVAHHGHMGAVDLFGHDELGLGKAEGPQQVATVALDGQHVVVDMRGEVQLVERRLRYPAHPFGEGDSHAEGGEKALVGVGVHGPAGDCALHRLEALAGQARKLHEGCRVHKRLDSASSSAGASGNRGCNLRLGSARRTGSPRRSCSKEPHA